jgi:hypothetical protein
MHGFKQQPIEKNLLDASSVNTESLSLSLFPDGYTARIYTALPLNSDSVLSRDGLDGRVAYVLCCTRLK